MAAEMVRVCVGMKSSVEDIPEPLTVAMLYAIKTGDDTVIYDTLDIIEGYTVEEVGRDRAAGYLEYVTVKALEIRRELESVYEDAKSVFDRDDLYVVGTEDFSSDSVIITLESYD